MSEYTTTPKLGLYKPKYNLDAEHWGDHLNANADTLDLTISGLSTDIGGPFLPIAGGNMGGPLNYYATGATALRSAQDRAIDVANVLDFGADPTYSKDSTAAFNAAASQMGPGGRNKAVYVPTGTYRVNGQITLTGAQVLYGDSRGSSILLIDQAFNPAATAVILLTQPPGGLDSGPVIRDLGIAFVQPPTALTRAGFKTLAQGGTCGANGTGIKYPWAIAAGAGSMRVQIVRVRIGGAWDGITSNNNNVVFYLEDLEIGALDCGISIGEGTGSLDTCHISSLHFWCFDLTYSGQNSVFMDGQTIALRLGRVDGFDCRGFLSHCGRIILTSEATGGYIFTHLFLDTLADIEAIGGSDTILQINNMTAGIISSLSRPVVAIGAGRAQIVNFVCNSNCSHPHLQVNGTADVTMTEINAWCWILNVPAVVVWDTATLRLSGKLIPMQTTGTYTGGIVSQNNASVLQVSRLDMMGPAGTTGTAIQVNVDNHGNAIDTVLLNAAGWSNIIVAATNGLYGPWISSTNPIPHGLHFGSNLAASPTDLSKHLELYTGYAGINVTSGAMNLLVADRVTLSLNTNGSGVSMPILQASTTFANDAAAATGGIPVGGIYRNGSQVMVRVS